MDLSTFCTCIRDLPTLKEPFSQGNYTYASNGHMIIRVPFRPDIPEKKPDNLQLENLVFLNREEYTTEFPKYKTEKKKCSWCRGSGRTQICQECDGDGYVELENDFNQYSAECKTCRGEGETPGGPEKCSNCDGTGQAYVDKYDHVDIGDVRLGKKLLDKIKDLPGVRLGPVDGAERQQVAFCFDGGDGILMTMMK